MSRLILALVNNLTGLMNPAADASQPSPVKSEDKRQHCQPPPVKSEDKPQHLSEITHQYHKIYDDCVEKMLLNEGIKKLELVSSTFASNLIAKTIVELLNRGLETLVLSGSDISGEDLMYIGENMSKNDSLKDLDLSHIPLHETGIKAVSKIKSKARHLEWLNLHNCELDGNLLETLSCAVGTEPVKALTLSSNPDIWNDVKIVAHLIENFGCNDIDISANSLGSEQIVELARTAFHGQVNTIHVCENPINDWEALGDLVRIWQIKNVDASECRMHLEDCEDFAFALDDYQLDELNVVNPDRGKKWDKKMEKILKGSAKHVTICV